MFMGELKLTVMVIVDLDSAPIVVGTSMIIQMQVSFRALCDIKIESRRSGHGETDEGG